MRPLSIGVLGAEAVRLTNLFAAHTRPNVPACSAWLTLLLAADARVHSLVNVNTALLSSVRQSPQRVLEMLLQRDGLISAGCASVLR